MGIGLELRWEGMTWRDRVKQERCWRKQRFGTGVTYRWECMWITYNQELRAERDALETMFPQYMHYCGWYLINLTEFNARYHVARMRYSKDEPFYPTFSRYLFDIAKIVQEKQNVEVNIS